MSKHEPASGLISRKKLLGAAAVGAGSVLAGNTVADAAGVLLTRNGGNRSEIHGDIVIGSSLPLTGILASDGQDMLRGFTLAIEEINAKGGILGAKVQHKYYDVGNMAPDAMVSNFRRLIYEDNVHAVLCGYHTGTGPEYPLVAQAGVPYFHVNTYSPNATTVREHRGTYWMVFQSDPTEVWYGLGLPTFLQGLIDKGLWKPKNKKVALITSNNLYSVSIANLFQQKATKTGWEISLYEKVVTPLSEWGPTLSKIRANPPAVIINTDFTPSDLATFTKQFHSNPTPSLLYEQYGPSIPEYLKLAGSAANGVIWSTVTGTYPDSIGNGFRARYNKRFGTLPGFSNAGSCYDEVHVYLNAVAKAGDPNDKRKVCDIVAKSNVRGVNGYYKYDPSDLTVRPYPDYTKDPKQGQAHLYFQIQNLRQNVIAPDPYTDSHFQLPAWI